MIIGKTNEKHCIICGNKMTKTIDSEKINTKLYVLKFYWHCHVCKITKEAKNENLF